MKKRVSKKKKVDTLKFFSEMQDKSDAKIKGYIDIQRAKSDEDIKRYTGALSEEFQGRVKGVAEQFGGLNTKIDKLQDTVDSHTEMIGSLMTDVSTIKSNMEFLKGALKKKVDYDEFLALERRLSLVEAKVNK